MRLSEVQRGYLIALYKQGLSAPQIVTSLMKNHGITVHRRTVERTINRFRERGTLSDLHGRGRKRCTTRKEDRMLRRMAKRNQWNSIPVLQEEAKTSPGVVISDRTLRERLKEGGLRRRIARRRPCLNMTQRKKKAIWVKKRKNWPLAQWYRIVFSDEKIFRVSSNRRGIYVTRTSAQKFHPNYVSPTLKNGCQIHVWAAIGYRGASLLKVVNGNLNLLAYQQQILHDIEAVGRKLAPRNRTWVFMHDNAPAHNSTSTRQFLAQKGVKILEWPGNSPDLNPIENMWGKVQSLLPRSLPRSQEDFLDQVRLAWKRIPLSYIRALMRSMPQRVRAVAKARGAQTRF